MKTTSIYVLAADRLIREGLLRVLDDGAHSVSGAGEGLDEALAAIADDPPDLMLVDCQARDVKRLAEIRSLSERRPPMRLVILTNALSIEELARSLAAGAHGYLMKSISSAALKQSLRLVMLGEIVFPSTLAALLVENAVDGPPPRVRPIAGLSGREVQILQSLIAGKANKVIAHDLGITESTVKVHLKGVLRKISATNRTQAALWALNNGVAPSSPPIARGGIPAG